MSTKRVFKYTDNNGIIQTDIELYNTSETQNEYVSLTQMKDRFYNMTNINSEKDWRDAELTSTDWFLLPDATYSGILVSGSSMYTDILAYRTALRNYAYSTSDPRPTKPTWYTG